MQNNTTVSKSSTRQQASTKRHTMAQKMVLFELHGTGPLCVRDIIENTGLTDHYVRSALQFLMDAGLVEYRKEMISSEPDALPWNVYLIKNKS